MRVLFLLSVIERIVKEVRILLINENWNVNDEYI